MMYREWTIGLLSFSPMMTYLSASIDEAGVFLPQACRSTFQELLEKGVAERVCSPVQSRVITPKRSDTYTDGKAKVAKQLIEAIDDETNSITLKVIEGDLLEDYKSFKAIIQATPKGEGSTVHWTLEYEKLHNQVSDPQTLLQFAADVSKDISDHLVKHNKT